MSKYPPAEPGALVLLATRSGNHGAYGSLNPLKGMATATLRHLTLLAASKVSLRKQLIYATNIVAYDGYGKHFFRLDYLT